tara:strand:+ start:1059 stop:1850 length:792 start_codon:yes stop_codon:yes gene_type:complete
MTEELMKLNPEITSGMATMTPNKIAKIRERMVEMDRANQSLGRKNTQTMNQLMTLTMLTESPYRMMRQCLTQIEKKRTAIEDSHFSAMTNTVNIKQLREKGDELSVIEAAKMEHGQSRHMIYIEGALKEIAVFQEAYDEIRKNHNIPENWDERDAELAEIRHHLRQAFRQSHRDMILTGTITQGNAEYLEQYGIHLQTARNVIAKYIATCEKLIEEGDVPNINHLYEFLDKVVEIFGNEYKHVMAHIGIDDLVRQEYLYRSNK